VVRKSPVRGFQNWWHQLPGPENRLFFFFCAGGRRAYEDLPTTVPGPTAFVLPKPGAPRLRRRSAGFVGTCKPGLERGACEAPRRRPINPRCFFSCRLSRTSRGPGGAPPEPSRTATAQGTANPGAKCATRSGIPGRGHRMMKIPFRGKLFFHHLEQIIIEEESLAYPSDLAMRRGRGTTAVPLFVSL